MEATVYTQLYVSINSGLLVLIWLVQIIIYPGMHAWDRETFSEQHRSYSHKIALIVAPLMLAQASLAARQLIVAPTAAALTQVLLIIFIWGVTALISVPLHRRLSAGYEGTAANRLINTNWLRTAGWSLVSLLDWAG